MCLDNNRFLELRREWKDASSKIIASYHLDNLNSKKVKESQFKISLLPRQTTHNIEDSQENNSKKPIWSSREIFVVCRGSYSLESFNLGYNQDEFKGPIIVRFGEEVSKLGIDLANFGRTINQIGNNYREANLAKDYLPFLRDILFFCDKSIQSGLNYSNHFDLVSCLNNP